AVRAPALGDRSRMRRTHACPRGTSVATRGITGAVSIALLLAFMNLRPGLAHADPENPNTVARLIAAVADANQKLQDLGAAVQTRQESVNKAIANVQTARDAADAARQDAAASQQGVRDANAAIAAAQQRFDNFAAATYVNGPSGSYLTA